MVTARPSVIVAHRVKESAVMRSKRVGVETAMFKIGDSVRIVKRGHPAFGKTFMIEEINGDGQFSGQDLNGESFTHWVAIDLEMFGRFTAEDMRDWQQPTEAELALFAQLHQASTPELRSLREKFGAALKATPNADCEIVMKQYLDLMRKMKN